jgi:ABC-type glycerol-3-phosphate transport system substrate-binding protein
MRTQFFFIVICFFILLAGCTSLPVLDNSTTPEPTSSPLAIETPQASETSAGEPNGPITLFIWLPPEFDPSAPTLAAELLHTRLEDFSSRHPGTRIEVRVKDLEGPGSLLDALEATREVAKLILPDIVILSRKDIEIAAQKDLIFSIESIESGENGDDWYDFALQLSKVNNLTFGYPLAGDAMVLIYRPSIAGDPPINWAKTLDMANQLAFPASDPQALFTLAMYLSTGGEVIDEENKPTLISQNLVSVLDFLAQSQESNLMPFWLTQYDRDELTWDAFQEKRVHMVATWISRYLTADSEEFGAAPLPTQSGQPFTVATGWSLAVSSPDPYRREISLELAEFLTESDFIAQWTVASGYLPPRPSALEIWPENVERAVVSQIIPTAQLIPNLEVSSIIGPALSQATIQILKQEADSVEASQSAIESLNNP